MPGSRGFKRDEGSETQVYARELPRRIHHVIVYVRDMKKAIAWYRDLLGLPLRFAEEWWAEFDTEGATLALHPRAKDESGGGRTGVSFSVLNVGATIDILRARGVKVTREPEKVGEGIRVAEIEDPEGNRLSLAGR